MEDRINVLAKQLSKEYEHLKTRINFDDDAIIEKQREHFTMKFSKEYLEEMTPQEALEQLMNLKNRESMVYYLEFKNDEEFKNGYFGGIGGGSSGKYTIFHSNQHNQWVKWEGNAQVQISDEEAENRANQIRNNLIKLHKYIQDNQYESLNDIRVMISEIESDSELKGFYRYGWVHKYFHIHYPEKVSSYHSQSMFKSILVKMKHPFSELLADNEIFSYFFDYFYIDLANRIPISQNDLSTLIWETYPAIDATSYYKVELSQYETQDVEKMVRSDYFFAPIHLPHDLTDITSLKEMRKFIKSINYTEFNATQVNLVTKGIKNNDITLLVDENKARYIGLAQGEYEYLDEGNFSHRIPISWHKIDSDNQFTISGKITKIINRVHSAQDQVNMELAIQTGEKITPFEAQPKKEIKPLKGKMRDIHSLLSKKKQIILTGAPGTGKTYWALETVYELIARQTFQNSYMNLSKDQQIEIKSSEQLKVVVLHSNYGYEEFVEGLRPENVNNELVFKVKDGTFKEFSIKAINNPNKNYYIVLDEINRADLTKIFGELIYSIENSKRGEYIELSVSNDNFTVPNNLYIIGTMNSADKSVSLIDLALRRRFGFIKLEPDYELLDKNIFENNLNDDEEQLEDSEEVLEIELENIEKVAEINIGEWLKNLNLQLIKTLGAEGYDLQIGHSFFLSKGEVISEPGQFIDVLKYEIMPLLEEYTYNNHHQLKEIIGDKMFDSSYRLKKELFKEDEFASLVKALEN